MAEKNSPVEQHKESFNLASQGYDKPALRGVRNTAERLVAVTDLRPGQHVLDIATGTGWAALAAAAAVGPSGSVVGIDIAEGMLARARQKAGEAGLRHVEFQAGDATKLPFEDGTFDAAVGASCLFAMPDAEAAVREWARVVKPGGKLAFSLWTETSFRPTLDLVMDHLQQAGVQVAPKGKRPYEVVQGRADARRLLDAAGLLPLRLETDQVGYYLTSKEELEDFVMGGGTRGRIEQLPEGALPGFLDKLLADLWRHAVAAGYWVDVSPVLAVGRRP